VGREGEKVRPSTGGREENRRRERGLRKGRSKLGHGTSALCLLGAKGQGFHYALLETGEEEGTTGDPGRETVQRC